MDTVDITIIGAGAVGLAVAERLASPERALVVLERNGRFGQETSSRNSEVIHAGIYYSPESLKATLCIRGNRLLYEYCRAHSLRHNRLGKIIIAVAPDEDIHLQRLFQNARQSGVEHIRLLTGGEVRSLEPSITARSGMLSEDTGIFDSHGFMEQMVRNAKEKGATVSFNSEVTAIEKTSDGYCIGIRESDYRFATRILINCAGLQSDRVAALAGIDVDAAGYRLHYCKGVYFRTRQPLGVRQLVYPVPDPQVHSLGIHLTPDLAGSLRFGPSAHYVDTIEYAVDDNLREEFASAVRRYLPAVRSEDFYPDTAGVRPKLQGPGEAARDFVIQHEKSRGLDGFINLVGIDSPGLTSALAIAEHVEQLVNPLL